MTTAWAVEAEAAAAPLAPATANPLRDPDIDALTWDGDEVIIEPEAVQDPQPASAAGPKELEHAG